MTVKKLFKAAAGALAMFGVLVLVGGSTASALSSGGASAETVAKAKASLNLVHEQFAATGFPTFYEDDITDPPGVPQIGQGFTLEEVLVNPSNVTIGTNRIECKIVALTPVPPTLTFACKAKFTFTNGATLKVVTAFNFDPANLPAMYDAYILSGTGVYAGAVGVIHVTDPGPGNPTGYVFDFYHL